MKKRVVIGLVSSATMVGLVAGGLSLMPGKADPETPIETTVQEHEQRLNQHEARIGNVENEVEGVKERVETVVVHDTTTVQSSPQTAPQTPTEPTPQPEPEPVTVVSYRQIPVEGTEDTDCEYTYSDGTTYQWHWQKVHYNQGTKITSSSGECNSSVIGRPKST